MFVNRRRESSSIYPKGSKVSWKTQTSQFSHLFQQFFIRISSSFTPCSCAFGLFGSDMWNLSVYLQLMWPATQFPLTCGSAHLLCHSLPAHANGTDQLSGFSADQCGKGHAVIKFDWKCTRFIFFNLCHTDQQTMRNGCKESGPKPSPFQVRLISLDSNVASHFHW